jgi:hypothetical protein
VFIGRGLCVYATRSGSVREGSIMSLGPRAATLVLTALGTIALARWADAQGTPNPRPGLTAQQTKEAIEISRGAMAELRKKTEGASNPDVDKREYVVGIELLAAGEPARTPGDAGSQADGAKNEPASGQPKEKEKTKPPTKKQGRTPGPLAVVTSYRYFDDITVFATVDLGAGRVVEVQAAQHLRTALSEGEYEEAKAMARQRSEPVKELFEKFGDKLSVYPQFSQYTPKGDPRVHRVVHLTYRVGTKDLSYPRPMVDLTTREVVTPAPEEAPMPRRAKP